MKQKFKRLAGRTNWKKSRCRHPQQGYRACLGILRMAKEFGNDRLEAACERAIAVGTPSYRSLLSILKHGLDRKPVSAPTQSAIRACQCARPQLLPLKEKEPC